MGYSTYFEDEIYISPEPTARVIAFIQNYYDEVNDRLDLEFTKEMMSLHHNGAEKSRLNEEMMQEFIDACVEKFPNIVFNGTLKASGEEYDDRWLLVVDENKARREEQILTGKKVTCPFCEEEFRLDAENSK